MVTGSPMVPRSGAPNCVRPISYFFLKDLVFPKQSRARDLLAEFSWACVERGAAGLGASSVGAAFRGHGARGWGGSREELLHTARAVEFRQHLRAQATRRRHSRGPATPSSRCLLFAPVSNPSAGSWQRRLSARPAPARACVGFRPCLIVGKDGCPTWSTMASTDRDGQVRFHCS
jgi:hypothetical protein